MRLLSSGDTLVTRWKVLYVVSEREGEGRRVCVCIGVCVVGGWIGGWVVVLLKVIKAKQSICLCPIARPEDMINF